jgi:aldehyde:ferredoxin oxidoreductase
MVDLTGRKFAKKEITDEDARKYFLGSGLAAKILLEEYDLKMDPLSPESPLIFLTGLLTGTSAPAGCKMSVCGKSPLTGIWGEATGGGFFPRELKCTGYDGIIFTGKSDKPVYLWLSDEEMEIRDGSHLQGKDSFETSRILKEEINDKIRVASIGEAGENLSKISGITLDGNYSRITARCGMGALMGSKNLKAVALQGKKRPALFNREEMIKLFKEQIPQIKENGAGLSMFGTAGGAPAVERFGDLPIKHWQLGSWEEEIQRISGQAIRENIWVKHYACFGCPIGCGKLVEIKDGKYGEVALSRGPEYETVGMLGANCLNDDLELLAKCNELCNRYSLDTISTGEVISFAMECYDKGMITKEMTGGLEIKWGSSEAMITLIHQMGRREGFGGEYLADGVKNAAEKIGKGSEKIAVHIKGLEMPAHDPRGHYSMGPHYATEVRGGCHLNGLTYFYDRGIPCEDLGYTPPPWDRFDPDGKARICYDYQNYLTTFNPLGLCKFLFCAQVGPKMVAKWISLICGWDVDMDELMKTGERILNLMRTIDLELGITTDDDRLPPRIMEPKPDGSAKGRVPPMDRLLKEIYELRGWDEEGIPTGTKLKELGLDRTLKACR